MIRIDKIYHGHSASFWNVTRSERVFQNAFVNWQNVSCLRTRYELDLLGESSTYISLFPQNVTGFCFLVTSYNSLVGVLFIFFSSCNI